MIISSVLENNVYDGIHDEHISHMWIELLSCIFPVL